MKGAYGVVKKATHKKTGLTRAVKVLKKAYLSEEEQEKVMNEVEVLRNLVRKGGFGNVKGV
jgi:serine/threonine protein kinase